MGPFEEFWTRAQENTETSVWKERLVFDKGDFITTLDVYFGKDGHPTQIEIESLPKIDPVDEKINQWINEVRKEVDAGNFERVETLSKQILYMKGQQETK